MKKIIFLLMTIMSLTFCSSCWIENCNKESIYFCGHSKEDVHLLNSFTYHVVYNDSFPEESDYIKNAAKFAVYYWNKKLETKLLHYVEDASSAEVLIFIENGSSPFNDNVMGMFFDSSMKIVFYTEELNKKDIKKWPLARKITMAHEFGHSLGLGHFPGGIMDQPSKSIISDDEAVLIKELYGIY